MAGVTLAMDAADGEARGRAIVQTLAAVVESMVHHAAHLPPSYQKTKFDAFRAPAISVRDYLARIHKYASCSPECFVLALVYVDRLHQLQGVVLTELNVHRVLLTSVVLAAKFFDDHYFNNAYYAKVGGVPGAEMNELELEFLLLVNFSLHVPNETYARYYNELANHYVFRSVRDAASPDAAFFHTRHYVVPDPDQDGALVYVTKQYPRHPPPAAVSASAAAKPALYSNQLLHHHHHPPLGPPQPHNGGGYYAVEEGESAAAGAATGATAGTQGGTAAGIACTKTSRASGQKRRSAVALGVNA